MLIDTNESFCVIINRGVGYARSPPIIKTRPRLRRTSPCGFELRNLSVDCCANFRACVWCWCLVLVFGVGVPMTSDIRLIFSNTLRTNTKRTPTNCLVIMRDPSHNKSLLRLCMLDNITTSNTLMSHDGFLTSTLTHVNTRRMSSTLKSSSFMLKTRMRIFTSLCALCDTSIAFLPFGNLYTFSRCGTSDTTSRVGCASMYLCWCSSVGLCDGDTRRHLRDMITTLKHQITYAIA